MQRLPPDAAKISQIKAIYAGVTSSQKSNIHDVLLKFLLFWSKVVRVALEFFAALYMVSFFWFLLLCRAAARRECNALPQNAHPSNLIPFERGLEMHMRKSPRAV